MSPCRWCDRQARPACSLLIFHTFSVSLLLLLFEPLVLSAPFVSVGEKKESKNAISQRQREPSKLLCLNKEIKILSLLGSGTQLAKVGCEVRMYWACMWEGRKKEVEIHGSVSASLTMAKMVSLVCDKVLTKTEKALNVWLEDISQKHISVDHKIMPEKAL